MPTAILLNILYVAVLVVMLWLVFSRVHKQDALQSRGIFQTGLACRFNPPADSETDNNLPTGGLTQWAFSIAVTWEIPALSPGLEVLRSSWPYIVNAT